MKILALDLGTKTGMAWSWGPRDVCPARTVRLATPAETSIWSKTRMDRRCDPRAYRLHSVLKEVVSNNPDVVVFEDVQFSSYTKQTQLWSALRTVVWLACNHPCITLECVPVTTLKKFATGFGQADKRAMKRALIQQQIWGWLYAEKLDDNAIDALWILEWAKRNLSRIA